MQRNSLSEAALNLPAHPRLHTFCENEALLKPLPARLYVRYTSGRFCAGMAESVDALDLKSNASRHTGSSPVLGTRTGKQPRLRAGLFEFQLSTSIRHDPERQSDFELHYRDVPYLFLRRRLLWGASSFLLQGLVLIGVMAMLLEERSVVWWLGVVLGSLPALLILGYALRVLSNPRRVAMLNKRNWRGPERVP